MLDREKFFWGLATSAFQIEGCIENDMTEWEGRGGFKTDGKDIRYGNGANHWQMWQEDFKILRDLNINAYRFSLEWGRLEPLSGQWDTSAFNEYLRMIDCLRKTNIEPFLTLLHFSHPQWFHKETPWDKPESIDRFCNYVDKVAGVVKSKVKYFFTLNEPLVWLLAAYGEAKFPPGKKNLNQMMVALHNLLLAHKKAYQIIKSHIPDAQIGIAKNFIQFNADRWWFLPDHGIQLMLDQFYNRMILNAFRRNILRASFPTVLKYEQTIELDNAIDFWGINYYYRMHGRFRFDAVRSFELLFRDKAGEGLSYLGWENYSSGLWDTLKMVRKYGKPMMITENGIATNDDRQRICFLKNHLAIIEKVVRKNFPLIGYFHWSFLDNYEWLEGKDARFGLVHVDYENNYKRSIKPSGSFYADYCRNRRLKQSKDDTY